MPAFYNEGPLSDLVMQFRFMMSLDELTHTRIVYNLLDYLGDIGGCLDALKYIGAFLVWILSGHSLGEFLTSEMFKVDNAREPNVEDDQDYAQ